MKIYGDVNSGNCYKVKLLCSMLSIEYEWVDVDTLAGDTANPDFLTKNPNGKIPLLELPDGRCLCESNAIINYLAAGSALLPEDAFLLAKVQQWQFYEQYSHEPYIAVARFIAKYLGMPDERRGEFEAKQVGGYKALAVMASQLSKSPYLVGETISTADISLYAYTHVAHEGGFDLARYPAIIAWMERVTQQQGYVAIG